MNTKQIILLIATLLAFAGGMIFQSYRTQDQYMPEPTKNEIINEYTFPVEKDSI